MAKREGSEFNMAEEIRTLLKEDKKLTGREVFNALKEKFPKQPINLNSCTVAFSNARKSMGLRSVRRPRPAKSSGPIGAVRPWAGKKAAASSSTSSAVPTALAGMDLLLAAKQLLQHCGGDKDAAMAAIRQVASLQMS
ncbi:MAG: hypothetical protein JNL58_05280 [Planctomyces sp.]|nr:hypothetical protein [Planctomyces sp.]